MLRLIKNKNTMKTLLSIYFLMFIIYVNAQSEISQNTEMTASLFEDVQLFPNPTSEIIFIKNGDKIDTYSIFDIQGRLVQSGIKNAQIISLIDIPVGYYFVELKIGEVSKRIKIQKY